MRGLVLALAVLLAATANAREARLPVPPVPPAEAPALAAPVPDLTVLSQYQDPGRYTVTLYTGINHRADPDTGLGYAPGARYQIDNDRRLTLPGVMVRIPLP